MGYPLQYSWASLVAQTVKNPPAKLENWVQSLGWEDPWRRAWQPTPVFLPGEFHGQRSLAGYSPWDCEELDTTKQLSLTLTQIINAEEGAQTSTLLVEVEIGIATVENIMELP